MWKGRFGKREEEEKVERKRRVEEKVEGKGTKRRVEEGV